MQQWCKISETRNAQCLHFHRDRVSRLRTVSLLCFRNTSFIKLATLFRNSSETKVSQRQLVFTSLWFASRIQNIRVKAIFDFNFFLFPRKFRVKFRKTFKPFLATCSVLFLGYEIFFLFFFSIAGLVSF